MTADATENSTPAPAGKPRHGGAPQPGRDITAAELRILIGDTALRGQKIGRSNGLPMPDADALADLAANINFFRGQYADALAQYAAAEPARKAARLRDALLGILPDLAAWENTLAAAEEFARPRRDRIRQVKAALESFALPQPTLYRAPGFPGSEKPDWRWIAGVLFADLNRAFSGHLGKRNDGPAARVITRILKAALGIAISSDTAAKFLREAWRPDP